MNIYLAGDSIVQNYTEEEFIAGWGQFLPRFFKPDVNVFNYAKGGRSSRLFINEGRFEAIQRITNLCLTVRLRLAYQMNQVDFLL